jgi:hypothetical protein
VYLAAQPRHARQRRLHVLGAGNGPGGQHGLDAGHPHLRDRERHAGDDDRGRPADRQRLHADVHAHIAPETTIDAGPTEPVHAGPLAFAVRASEDADIRCALDGDDFGSCAQPPRAEGLALGDHVYRARATDRAGNADATPDEWPFTVANVAPAAPLELSPSNLTVSAAIAATDADGDALTYVLDFGDGSRASGALPSGRLQHSYDAPGTYTARLEVRDARTTTVTTQEITLTAPQPASNVALSLSLEARAAGSDARAGGFGMFIPGVARDYTLTMIARATGAGTLTVADRGATAPGHLTSGAAALSQPLQVRAGDGAFQALPLSVTAADTVFELKQSIGASDRLTTGRYAKALTFTLTPAGP